MLTSWTNLKRTSIQGLSRKCCRVRRERRGLLTLAIETSCDDTAVALLEKNAAEQAVPQGLSQQSARLLFNERITSRNTGKGGIHPMEALESHEVNLASLVNKAILSLPVATGAQHQQKYFTLGDGSLKRIPDFISVTRGPGMRSNLACGLNTAKGLAVSWQIPIVGVHHMQAHALTPRMQSALDPDSSARPAQFPFVSLLVSGGHTMLLHSTSITDHKILATTRDIAIGDGLDKCGRELLPRELISGAKDTAFAKYLSDWAFPTTKTYDAFEVPRTRQDELDRPVNQYGWQLKSPLSETRELAFSFTGIATQISRIYNKRSTCSPTGHMTEEETLLLARTAIGTAFEHLGSRTIIALEQLKESNQPVSQLVVSGGVAANSFLRHFLRRMLDVRGFDDVEILFPSPEFCTDNAAMIAWAGMEMFESGWASSLDITAIRKWSLSASEADGGILGAGGWMRSSS